MQSGAILSSQCRSIEQDGVDQQDHQKDAHEYRECLAEESKNSPHFLMLCLSQHFVLLIFDKLLNVHLVALLELFLDVVCNLIKSLSQVVWRRLLVVNPVNLLLDLMKSICVFRIQLVNRFLFDSVQVI